MAATPSERRKPAEHVSELKDLVVGYARQETLDPLKNLGRYLGFGVGGAVLVGLGSILLLLGLLRGLQSIDGIAGNDGALSLIPYGATLVAAAAIIGLAVSGIIRGGKKGPGS